MTSIMYNQLDVTISAADIIIVGKTWQKQKWRKKVENVQLNSEFGKLLQMFSSLNALNAENLDFLVH